jgi:hypothetical protein
MRSSLYLTGPVNGCGYRKPVYLLDGAVLFFKYGYDRKHTDRMNRGPFA